MCLLIQYWLACFGTTEPTKNTTISDENDQRNQLIGKPTVWSGRSESEGVDNFCCYLYFRCDYYHDVLVLLFLLFAHFLIIIVVITVIVILVVFLHKQHYHYEQHYHDQYYYCVYDQLLLSLFLTAPIFDNLQFKQLQN